MSLSLAEPAGVGEPSSAGEALQMALTGLGWLARADLASVPVPVQAEALRVLERAASMQTAARARVLAAFSAQRGFEDDGQGSARMWLTWQTRVTAGAARGTVGWMRRLENHPAVAEALAGGVLSVSWARQLTDWTGALPVAARPDADAILLAAAADGADLAGLAGLAEEIRRRVAGPDQDGEDGFSRRGLQLDTTFGGAGRLTGDLSARCAASLQAVLDSLGKKMGAEDTRSRGNASMTRWRRRACGCWGRGACRSGPGSRSGWACTCRWTSCSAGSAARAGRTCRPGSRTARTRASVGRRPGPAAGTWLAGSRLVRAGAGGGVGRAR